MAGREEAAYHGRPDRSPARWPRAIRFRRRCRALAWPAPSLPGTADREQGNFPAIGEAPTTVAAPPDASRSRATAPARQGWNWLDRPIGDRSGLRRCHHLLAPRDQLLMVRTARCKKRTIDPIVAPGGKDSGSAPEPSPARTLAQNPRFTASVNERPAPGTARPQAGELAPALVIVVPWPR